MNVKKIGKTLEQHSPEMLVGAGIVGIIVGTVKLCKASKKADEVIDEAKAELDAVHAEPESVFYKRRLTAAYAKFLRNILKAYGPGAMIEGFGVVCLILSNDIYRNRAITWSAAYTAINEMYYQYRERVKDKYGEEADRDIVFGMEEETVKEEYVDENGKKHTKKKKVKKPTGRPLHPYCRVFGPNSRLYVRGDNDFNIWQLQDIENTFNRKLPVAPAQRISAYEVLSELDLLYFECQDNDPKTRRLIKKLQNDGWVWDPDGPEHQIDFGLKNKNTNGFGGYINGDAMNGFEEEIMLEFNCVENIWD